VVGAAGSQFVIIVVCVVEQPAVGVNCPRIYVCSSDAVDGVPLKITQPHTVSPLTIVSWLEREAGVNADAVIVSLKTFLKRVLVGYVI
jgi:hypothetical protein